MARLAKSLETLRNQINASYPSRSKASDGWIGDAAHQATASDHNPNSAGVVCGLDVTHDPAHGVDIHVIADRLLANRHPNLKYIISNRRIAGAWTGWKWQAYNGSNPHNKHAHFSVGVGTDGKSAQPYDDTTQWKINGAVASGGNEVFNNIQEVTEAYIQMRGVAGTQAEMQGWIGQSKQRWIQLSTLETNSLRQQLADVRAALANEQAKPPKEVVKEVIKIVDKPIEVIKEVPVYTHDEDTKQNVNKILGLVQSLFDYFKGQYKTFSKYVKKG